MYIENDVKIIIDTDLGYIYYDFSRKGHHNSDGPARIWYEGIYKGTVEYYIMGKYLKEKEFYKQVAK